MSARPRIALLSGWRAALRRRLRAWVRRRHGIDPDPFTLPGRRIYILPTRLGVAFGVMVFAMFLGAMNYANNLALALAFVLGALGLVAMQHSHRNLAGVRLRAAPCEPVFAGQMATFRIAVENPSPVARYEITVANEHGRAAPVCIDPHGRAVLEVAVPAARRGRLALAHVDIETRHPFGLFRAWAHLHPPMQCIVWPRPCARGLPPPPTETDTGGAQDSLRGEEDFAGLRSFHRGDSPRRIAWKAYARGQGLMVKVYAGTAVTSHRFDWQALPHLEPEARLAQLCRWIEDAHAGGHAFGLTLPGVKIAPDIGPAHRHRCLTALALFEPGEVA